MKSPLSHQIAIGRRQEETIQLQTWTISYGKERLYRKSEPRARRADPSIMEEGTTTR